MKICEKYVFCSYIYPEWCHHYAVETKTYDVWRGNAVTYLVIARQYDDCAWNPPIMLSNLLSPVLKIGQHKNALVNLMNSTEAIA